MTRRKTLLFGLPLLAAAGALLALLALPSFVASTAHRARIEALASALTGRQVTIGGNLHLALLPRPQFVAERVTITGRTGDSITARSLTLDIALAPLLAGRLAARDLTLQSPTIILPWPPAAGGGPNHAATNASAVHRGFITPPWLAATHAQIDNGRLSIGALNLSHVSADIFTAADGAVSLSGNATLAGMALTVSVGLGPGGASAPISVDITGAGGLTAHLSGSLTGTRRLQAALRVAGIPPGATRQAAGTATIDADETGIAARDLKIIQGDASLAGSAAVTFTSPVITANLSSQNLDLTQFLVLARQARALPSRLHFTGVNASLNGIKIPLVSVDADMDRQSLAWRQLSATLPGGAALVSSGHIDGAGNLSGQASLTAADLPALLAGAGIGAVLPPQWRQIKLAAKLSGRGNQLCLGSLAGELGAAKLSGNLAVSHPDHRIVLAGEIHLDQLDIASLGGLLRQPAAPEVTADLQITADHAALGDVPMTDLLIDAALGNGVTVRRLSASVFGGLLAGSLKAGPDGYINNARAMLSLPSAARLAALAPVTWAIPAALTKAPLAAALLARGPLNALAVSATATVGQFSVTAAPLIDVAGRTASGAFTLRHPDAIAALGGVLSGVSGNFGLPASLAWPGAGSLSLRADLAVSPTRVALPDFVLSLGDLTAEGKLIYGFNHQIQADIDAGTLALPLMNALPWRFLRSLHGQIDIHHHQVWLAGQPVLGDGTERLTLSRRLLTMNIPGVSLAGGVLAGSLSASLAPKAPVLLAASLSASRVDAGALDPPVPFPITLATGRLAGRVNVVGDGASLDDWLATLDGTAALHATNGTLNGFSLAGLARALKSSGRTVRLRNAAAGGPTVYQNIDFAGSLADGTFTVTTGGLSGPDGNAVAAGSIDTAHQKLRLTLSMRPHAAPATAFQSTMTGPWQKPAYGLKITIAKPASQK